MDKELMTNEDENSEIDSPMTDQLVEVECIDTGHLKILSQVNWISHFPIGKSLTIKKVIFIKDLDKATDYFENVHEGLSQMTFRIKDRWSGYIPVRCITMKGPNKQAMIWSVDSDGSPSTNLLAVAAHDLMSPINSIIGLTTVIQMMLKDQEPNLSEVRKMVRLIKNSCNSALDFTNDLIELSEVESNGKELNQEKYHLLEFIEHFADTNRLIPLRKNIKIKIESRISHEDTFCCNRPKMHRALSNLISNATKFSEPGGTIVIKLEKDEAQTIIRIIDEGVGMSKEILDNIFVKFGKSKRIGLDGEKSHGLGMSIVKQIVEMHGGKIQVFSQENSGTTVSIILNNN